MSRTLKKSSSQQTRIQYINACPETGIKIKMRRKTLMEKSRVKVSGRKNIF